MEIKEVQVVCPCCDSRLAVDVRSGRVMRSVRPQELDETGKPVMRAEDWDSASQRAQGRLGEAKDKFEQGLEREKKRETDLDDLFRKTKKKLDEGADE